MGRSLELKENMKTMREYVEEKFTKQKESLEKEVAPLRDILQKESEAVGALQKKQNDAKKKETVIQNVINTEVAKLRRSEESCRKSGTPRGTKCQNDGNSEERV